MPRAPAGWTYDAVLEAIRRYRWEPAVLDFKEVLHPAKGNGASRQRHNDHIRQTAGAFANSLGGHFVFGVRNPATEPTASPESLAAGISLAGDLRKEFGDKLAGVLPPLDFEAGPVPAPGGAASGRGFVVVYVPQSPMGTHMDADGCFYRRDAKGGNEHMEYSTVRDRFLAGADQQRKLRMLRLELQGCSKQALRTRSAQVRVTAPYPLWRWPTLERFDAANLKALLIDTMDLLPTELPEHIYELAGMALQANRALDQANAEGGRGPEEAALSGLLEGIITTAESCERLIRELFGSPPAAK